MSLSFHISPASDVPIFRQIAQQVQRAVATGKLVVGEQLPPVRTLAENLVINPNTVAKSYQELIRDGVLESRAGRGIFVSERRQVFSDSERLRRLQQAADLLCHEAMLHDTPLPEIHALLDAAWKELHSSTQAPQTPSERKPK